MIMKKHLRWNKEGLSPVYQIFILVVSVYSLLQLAIETMLRLNNNTLQILDITDFFVCVIFFMDFLILFFRAQSKTKYFFTWGWLDLLSSVPAIQAFRWWRIARVIRILRFLRILRSTRIIGKAILGRKIQSVFLSVVLIAFTLVITSSILVLNFESKTNGPIKTPFDAIWWSISTLTTVGYGDVYPVSLEGRMVAIVLMIAGVGIFGTFSGFIASWIIGPTQKKESVDIEELREELKEIKATLKEIKTKLELQIKE